MLKFVNSQNKEKIYEKIIVNPILITSCYCV
jgi:hypothetical protein